MLVNWQDIKLAYPDKTVLDGISLTVYPGDRIALLGDNGAGKTSLFRILQKKLRPDSGTVSISAGTRIGYLEQSLDGTEDDERRTCMEIALETFPELARMEREILSISIRLTSADPEESNLLLEKLGELQQHFEADGGYTFRPRVESTLTNLGLSEETWERPVASLSSGQRVRLALAKVLLEENDLLLLDEPTNHLDIEAREWLESHLKDTSAAVIVASHDRRFLDVVAHKVAHLELGEMKVYPGNYSAFRRQRDEQIAADWAVYEKRQKETKKLRKQAEAYAGWATNREKDKIGNGPVDRGFIGARSARMMKKSKNVQRRMEKTIEEMETDKPHQKKAVKLQFAGKRGRTLITAEDLSIGYSPDEPLAEDLSFVVEGGDRFAVVGPNGSGKTTLLSTLLGGISPLAGEVRLHPTLSVGYFDQEQKQIPSSVSALDAVLESEDDETMARTVMARMRIRRDSVYKKFGSLSAGERAKVMLTKLILGDHDLLVLDEPTNYLDIDTQDVLLDSLSDFPGGIVFVSHDRHFVESLATEVIELT